jgi:hypothetical protein
MSHQDKRVAGVFNADYLKVALRWLLAGLCWSGVGFRPECSWTPALLSSTALLWAWSDELTLADRFRTARRIVIFLFPGQEKLAGTYQAFLEMLRRWTARLRVRIQAALQGRMQCALRECWLVAGFVMFGIDGSRAELPRTQSNEDAYAASRKDKKRKKKKKGKKGKRKTGGRKRPATPSRKADSPQMWLTTMWHVGTGLPWDWRTGPSDSSERGHLLEMLAGLPPEALITADAGFVGYEYAKAILDSGRQLLIRVGSNVRLLKDLGQVREHAGTVYLWPKGVAKKKQPPLALRIVVAHNGKHPVSVVTSITSKSTLSDKQVLELYARRWGIELFYRSFKQTFNRRKLRSLTAANAEVEMEWSLLGLWAMMLYALVEARKDDLPPQRLSTAGVLRAFRRVMRDYQHRKIRGESLCCLLRASVIDDYERENKTSRNYPRKKQESPPGAPQITPASQDQRELATILRKQTTQKP